MSAVAQLTLLTLAYAACALLSVGQLPRRALRLPLLPTALLSVASGSALPVALAAVPAMVGTLAGLWGAAARQGARTNWRARLVTVLGGAAAAVAAAVVAHTTQTDAVLVLTSAASWAAGSAVVLGAVAMWSGRAALADAAPALGLSALLTAIGAAMVPTYLADPRVVVVVVAAAAVVRAELRSLESRLQSGRTLARTDSLTGLLNHAACYAALDTTLDARPAALVLLDLDHFKVLNDLHGHAAGDDALRALAALLRTRAPAGAMCARYGGDEFALILPQTPLAAATAFARALRRAAADALGPLTISCGVTAGAGTAEALVASADRALYAAKHKGRNRVCSTRTTGESLLVRPRADRVALDVRDVAVPTTEVRV